MEQFIITGLLLIIILLLWNKKSSNPHNQENNINNQQDISSIMGKIKKEARKPVPSGTDQGQNESVIPKANNFDSETKEEVIANTTSKKELDEILDKDTDQEEEEEDWWYQHDSKIESGFATGVTFQELSTAGQLLQQDVLEPDLKQQAVNIIQKIQGTELFDLLENSLGDASKRVANLLSQNIPNEDDEIYFKRQDDPDGFDIGEFV